MEEEIISFETAKLAKEKGFSIPISKYYRSDEKLIINFEDSGGNEREYYFDANSFDENWNDNRVVNKNNESCWGCNNGYFQVYSAPSQSLLQKWLRETYNIHINIRHEEYFHDSNYRYFHFDISHNTLSDITKNEDLYESILKECSQDIPGNYLNNKKHSKLIFEKKFAFKTYEECLEKALQEGLKLIK